MKTHLPKGFTLTELMIVVATIGILAALAFPAYQDYTTRAKVTELILAASNAKTAIAENFTLYPNDPGVDCINFTVQTECPGYGVTIPVVGKIGDASVNVSGIITLYADASLNYVVIRLVPTYSETTGTISWTCVTKSIYFNVVPASCRNVMEDILPASDAPGSDAPGSDSGT